MQLTKRNKLVNICLIATFCIGGLAACNSNDYNSSDSGTDRRGAKNKITAADSTATKDTTATNSTAKVVKKKGRASVMMPAGNNNAEGMAAMVKDKDGVYDYVQVMPEFPGGQDALANYVNNNVQFPQQAIDDNTTGIVKISFVVDENGKISHAHLMNIGKVGKGLDEEALRVVNSMPAWKPGQIKGKSVKTRLELPISFQFEA